MYAVHPNNGECFYLRILLSKVRGPVSFEHLKTVGETVCETFREACLRRGYLDDNRQWQNALEEAKETRLSVAIGSLFAIIVRVCSPAQPPVLWANFKTAMSEDILAHQSRVNSDIIIDFNDRKFSEALIQIEDIVLAKTEQTSSRFGVPSPVRDSDYALASEVLRETSYDVDHLEEFVLLIIGLLNPEQRSAFNTLRLAIQDAIRDCSTPGRLFFLHAPGGTGETFLLNLLLADVRSQRNIILATASSGIAATLMPGGRTTHSAFKLPLDII